MIFNDKNLQRQIDELQYGIKEMNKKYWNLWRKHETLLNYFGLEHISTGGDAEKCSPALNSHVLLAVNSHD